MSVRLHHGRRRRCRRHEARSSPWKSMMPSPTSPVWPTTSVWRRGWAAAAAGWGAARLTETHPSNLTGVENALSQVKDGLMAVAVVSGIANGVQGARLARQAPDGAVPIETGTTPATHTPPKAAKIQRSLG